MKKYFLLFSLLFIIIFQFIIISPALAYCTCTCTDGSTHEAKDDNDCENICLNKSSGTNTQITQKGNCIPIKTVSKTDSVKIYDPLNLNNDPNKLYARVIQGLLGFVGVAALTIFVYAGFMFLFSSGNAEQTKKAKDTMRYAA